MQTTESAVGKWETDSLASREKKWETGEERLIFQGHHGLIAAAEGRHTLEAAVRLFHQHNRTIAEHGMTTFRHVPRTTLARMVSHGMINRRARRRCELGTGQRQRQ